MPNNNSSTKEFATTPTAPVPYSKFHQAFALTMPFKAFASSSISSFKVRINTVSGMQRAGVVLRTVTAILVYQVDGLLSCRLPMFNQRLDCVVRYHEFSALESRG